MKTGKSPVNTEERKKERKMNRLFILFAMLFLGGCFPELPTVLDESSEMISVRSPIVSVVKHRNHGTG